MATIPNLAGLGSPSQFPEGISSIRETLTPEIDEEKVKSVISNRISEGMTYWNDKLNLSRVREDNERRWLNQNLEVGGTSLYDFQTPYRDNRIFVSVETLSSNIVGRVPYPEVTEGQDTEASRELAHQYEKILFAVAEDNLIKPKLQMVARHLLIGYRLGAMKIAWNKQGGMRKEDGGFHGDIWLNYIRPHRLVIDAESHDKENIPLIAESLNTTLEELGYMFPDKKDQLYKQVAGQEGGEVPILQTRLDYHEVWFTFFNSEGEKQEGVAWVYKPVVLDYGLNPYYNYSTSEGKTNFFDSPKKPYVLFNFLQLGRWVMDDSSLTEQASTLQDVLEKRGRQIVDNADQAAATRVFNTMMINARDAEKYVGNPKQNILVKGDVRTAFARFPAPELPRYVLEDKYDARTEIDNIFGTHAPLRGEKTSSPTLGQEVLSQRSDIGRTSSLTESIETGATEVYRWITQLYKVFATEPHIAKYAGEDGKMVFTNFSGDKIEDGVQIRVRAGSVAAEDKMSDRTEALELVKVNKIDPLTFAEKWHLEQPREFAKRLIYYLVDPAKYIAEVLQMGQAGGDQEAQEVLKKIMAGENVPPAKNPTKEYLAYFNQFIKSPEFAKLDPEVKNLVLQHIRGTMAETQGGMKEQPKQSFFGKMFGGGQPTEPVAEPEGGAPTRLPEDTT